MAWGAAAPGSARTDASSAVAGGRAATAIPPKSASRHRDAQRPTAAGWPRARAACARHGEARLGAEHRASASRAQRQAASPSSNTWPQVAQHDRGSVPRSLVARGFARLGSTFSSLAGAAGSPSPRRQPVAPAGLAAGWLPPRRLALPRGADAARIRAARRTARRCYEPHLAAIDGHTQRPESDQRLGVDVALGPVLSSLTDIANADAARFLHARVAQQPDDIAALDVAPRSSRAGWPPGESTA